MNYSEMQQIQVKASRLGWALGISLFVVIAIILNILDVPLFYSSDGDCYRDDCGGFTLSGGYALFLSVFSGRKLLVHLEARWKIKDKDLAKDFLWFKGLVIASILICHSWAVRLVDLNWSLKIIFGCATISLVYFLVTRWKYEEAKPSDS